MLAQAAEHDDAHFLAQPCKSSETIEDGFAPEKLIGCRRQLMTKWTQLQADIRAMILEIAAHDAILQHPAEQDSVAAGRAFNPPRPGAVGAQRYGKAQREREER